MRGQTGSGRSEERAWIVCHGLFSNYDPADYGTAARTAIAEYGAAYEPITIPPKAIVRSQNGVKRKRVNQEIVTLPVVTNISSPFGHEKITPVERRGR